MNWWTGRQEPLKENVMKNGSFRVSGMSDGSVLITAIIRLSSVRSTFLLSRITAVKSHGSSVYQGA
jgi:hypothetical protein